MFKDVLAVLWIFGNIPPGKHYMATVILKGLTT